MTSLPDNTNVAKSSSISQEAILPAEEEWDLWLDDAHSPAFNMAADEMLLETAPVRGRPLLRVYQWDRPSVSIGYIQRRDSAPAGYAVVRRPTGGGIVYHDFDYTYTVVFPEGHWLTGLDRTGSYNWLNQVVQEALRRLGCKATLSQAAIAHEVDRLTMVCFKNPTRYDVELDGRKIAGSAQRRTTAGILHQGSLHFGKSLPYNREEMTQQFLLAFTQRMHVSFTPFTPTDALQEQIHQRCREKYETEQWNNRK